MKTRSKEAKKAEARSKEAKKAVIKKEEDGWKKLTPELLSLIFENIDLHERRVPAFCLEACMF